MLPVDPCPYFNSKWPASSTSEAPEGAANASCRLNSQKRTTPSLFVSNTESTISAMRAKSMPERFKAPPTAPMLRSLTVVIVSTKWRNSDNSITALSSKSTVLKNALNEGAALSTISRTRPNKKKCSTTRSICDPAKSTASPPSGACMTNNASNNISASSVPRTGSSDADGMPGNKGGARIRRLTSSTNSDCMRHSESPVAKGCAGFVKSTGDKTPMAERGNNDGVWLPSNPSGLDAPDL
mmetsp:Transcript_82050/g.237906  ORF Transcript_82050/g.237906 Transcript_82050/m.237906 type:complete len:240 (+) Transcript_82050:182-901(+)